MTDIENIKVTDQSFREAGGLESFPHLNIGGMVYVTGSCIESKNKAFEFAHTRLQDKAREEGYTHIFNVKCNITRPDDAESFNVSGELLSLFEATGTGYKSRNE